jgi:hypothetical protein
MRTPSFVEFGYYPDGAVAELGCEGILTADAAPSPQNPHRLGFQ